MLRGRYSPFNLAAFNQRLDHGLLLGLTGQGVGGGADDHGLGSNDSPTWTGATLSGLTQGSVLFAGASGVISQDNSNLFWDDTNNRLGIGINTGFDSRTGLTVSGDIDILHTATESDDHAFEIDIDAAGFGDVKAVDLVYVSGDISAGEDEEVILANIDESDSEGGDIAAVEVLTTAAGSATTKIFGLEVGIKVTPIEQLSGTFGDMAKAENDGVNALTEFTTSDPGEANNIEIFVGEDDTVLIGNTAKFEEIEFILETFSLPSIKPTFEFSTGGTGFSPFTPADGTNGLRNNGVILWLDSDIPSWAKNTGGNYEIRITRTRANLTATPKEDLIQIGTAVEYVWDKDGDVNIKGLTLSGDLTMTGAGTSSLLRDRTTGNFLMHGGSSLSTGAYFNLTGSAYATSPGYSSAEFVIGEDTNATYMSKFSLFSYDGASTWTERFKLIGSSGAVTIAGTLGCGEITVVDGSSINLQEALTFTGATTENLIEMPDNLADALSFKEDTNAYLTFVTTNSGEKLLAGKDLDMGTNSITNATAVTAGGIEGTTIGTFGRIVINAAGGLDAGAVDIFNCNSIGIDVLLENLEAQLQFGTAVPVIGSENTLYMGYNCYYDGSWKRIHSDDPPHNVMLSLHSDGTFNIWTNTDELTAADSAITWDSRFLLSKAGNLTIDGSFNCTEILAVTDSQHKIVLDPAADHIHIHPGDEAGDNYLIIRSTGAFATSPAVYPSANGEGQVGTSGAHWDKAWVNNIELGNDMTIADAGNIILATTNGTKIGTANDQKLGFYGHATTAQQAGVLVTAAGIHAALVNLGLITA